MFVTTLGLSACGHEIEGTAIHSRPSPMTTAPQGPRQTDAVGQKLPFETLFEHRWNRGNNGSNYEPCTSLTSQQVRDLGFDPSSVHDAAIVDGQTARGCSWEALPPMGSMLRIGQAVGNSASLLAFKRKNSAHSKWFPDVLLSGRVVGVEQDAVGGCTTYVQSGRAGVTTGVTSTASITIDEQCDKAIAFTRATIDKMPP